MHGSHYFYLCHTEASIVVLQELAYKGWPEREKNKISQMSIRPREEWKLMSKMTCIKYAVSRYCILFLTAQGVENKRVQSTMYVDLHTSFLSP